MDHLFASGLVVDIMIALVLIEAAALAAFHAATGRGLSLRAVAANLTAGLMLMLALRAALVDADPTWIAAFLVAALLSHAADLAARLSSSAATPSIEPAAGTAGAR
jgi:hypothetical protein